MNVDVSAIAVPAEGHVLWVATLPDDVLTEDAVDDLLVHLHSEAERAAPGRSTVVALAAGAGLQLLTDGQLAAIGLTRLDRPVDAAEDAPRHG